MISLLENGKEEKSVTVSNPEKPCLFTRFKINSCLITLSQVSEA